MHYTLFALSYIISNSPCCYRVFIINVLIAATKYPFPCGEFGLLLAFHSNKQYGSGWFCARDLFPFFAYFFINPRSGISGSRIWTLFYACQIAFQKGCVNLYLPFSSAGLTLVVPQPCQHWPLRVSLLAKLIGEKWFLIFDFAFLWLQARSNIFLLCSVPDNVFLVPIVYSYALSIYLFVGGRFHCFSYLFIW